ncbi:hypothetical protein JTE90_016222 [Oedothorax gibbosus]|uniref:EF-hand domain-containing protein n=1 Tax=Oedothorax gibbosus TaxID=931172 RepID=A0AAV6VSM8_9ARAC|nr:hypothetical protein JTE90_016222 [Oedothorax gibbosus]
MKPINRKERSYEEQLDDYLLRNVFALPPNSTPKHPILSSPFARKICESAFSPRKPKWFKPLTFFQNHQFQEVLHQVEVAMKGNFRFSGFLGALQRFDPTVTRSEVTDILYDMEIEEQDAGELDFGRFLFLLAYRNARKYEDYGKERVSTTPRQCLILSAIACFVSTVKLVDIEKYYLQNRSQKPEVLYQSLQAVRLAEKARRNKVNQKLKQQYLLTDSPYAQPVAGAPSPIKKKQGKQKRKFDSKLGKASKKDLKYDNELENLKETNQVKLLLPNIHLKNEMLHNLQSREHAIKVQDLDYLIQKDLDAKRSLKNRIKEAKIEYGKKYLGNILQDEFASKEDRDAFIKIYQRYFPMEISEEEI